MEASYWLKICLDYIELNGGENLHVSSSLWCRMTLNEAAKESYLVGVASRVWAFTDGSVIHAVGPYVKAYSKGNRVWKVKW